MTFFESLAAVLNNPERYREWCLLWEAALALAVWRRSGDSGKLEGHHRAGHLLMNIRLKEVQ